MLCVRETAAAAELMASAKNGKNGGQRMRVQTDEVLCACVCDGLFAALKKRMKMRM